jgi:phosphatidate cytidylyltransferase
MLRWRLLLGVSIIGALVGLCWLDHRSTVPGAWLLPVLAAFAVLGTQETLELLALGGMKPVRWPVYLGVLVVLAANWAPCLTADGACRLTTEDAFRPAIGAALTWPMAALSLVLLGAFATEMYRYRAPGGVNANVAGAVFAVMYVGVCLTFAVQLRLIWGVGALASLILVVKSGDTGAYAVGRLIGRHKLTPTLSPGKTVEGAAGALAASVLASWAALGWLVPTIQGRAPSSPAWAWILFGLCVGGAGIFGDLAESLIKRDSGQKDSSTWLPGLGGVLDILDSILLAAPVAFLFWATGIAS